MFGASYMGYAQLAAGPDAPDYLKALVPLLTASKLYNINRGGGSFNLLLALSWSYSTYAKRDKATLISKGAEKKRDEELLKKGLGHLPVGESDKVILGFSVPFYQSMVNNDNPTDEYWSKVDLSGIIGRIEAPVHFVAGWYDFFLTDEIADYKTMSAAGKNPYLTIGPWTHLNGFKGGIQESFVWYDAHLRGDKSKLREKPVKVCIMGKKEEWVEMDAWPPQSVPAKLYLGGGGKLSEEKPGAGAEPTRYRYDPADPTPSLGGAVITEDSGKKNNIELESRKDVLTFTSEPMKKDTTIMGTVCADLFVRSTLEHTDFFVRLCDVSPNGRKSENICDGMVRLKPGVPKEENGMINIKIELNDTAYCFKTGHRIRLQVSSGAHPMFVRNLGGGERIATATIMKAADQEVFHDEDNCSALILPMIE